MKKMSLQWRLTIITTLFIAVICGCLTLFVYKNGVYYIDLLQDTVDAQSDEDNSEEADEIYINIPDDKWDDFADDFSIQVYNNKADYKKRSLLFSTLLAKFCRDPAIAVSTPVFVVNRCDFFLNRCIFVFFLHLLQMIVESGTG